MAVAAATKAEKWLVSDEARQLFEAAEEDSEAVKAIEDHFADWMPSTKTIDGITRYLVVGYLNAGTGAGQALRLDPATAIIRCVVGDSSIVADDPIKSARKIRDSCPAAFQYMLTLFHKHSEICRDVLRDAFKSDTLELRRGVHDDSQHYAVESWSFRGPVSSYGPITLSANVPLSSVLSLRAQEHEIVVLRHPWESSISAEMPPSEVTPWRERIAALLEDTATRLRHR